MSSQKNANQAPSLFDVSTVASVVPTKKAKNVSSKKMTFVQGEVIPEMSNSDLGLNGCYKNFGETIRNRGNSTPEKL